MNSTFTITSLADGADAAIRITGFFRSNLTLASVMDFQWAQNSSDADASTVENGAWIRVTRIS